MIRNRENVLPAALLVAALIGAVLLSATGPGKADRRPAQAAVDPAVPSREVVPRDLGEPASDPPGVEAFQRYLGSLERPKLRAYARASRQIQAMTQSVRGQAAPTAAVDTGAVAATWRNIGPSNVGGMTRGFAIDPRNPDTMYMGGLGGGVWKTTDGGKSWRPLTDTQGNLSIGSIVIDPSDPSTIYAGTGYVQDALFGRTSAVGSGILRSTDGGANWTTLESTQTKDFRFTSSLAINRSDPDRIFAATFNGIWRSIDRGGTWTRVLEGTTLTGCTDVVLGAGDVVLASCGGLEAAQGVFYSDDGGTTWQQTIGSVNGEPAGVTAVAFAPSDPKIVYASVASVYQGPSKSKALGLLRSDQGGAPDSWTIQNSGDASPGSPPWLTNCSVPQQYWYHQGFYDNVIGVDPTDPNRVWVGGIDLFRSEDAGKTFRIASYWWLDEVLGWSKPTDNTQYVHADQHGIYFDPAYDGASNRRVFFVGDGGLFRTDNDRAALPHEDCTRYTRNLNEVKYVPLNNGYATTLFVEGAVAAKGDHLLGGLQDNGTVIGRTGSTLWTAVADGDGAHPAIAPDESSVYVSMQNGYILKSTDVGQTVSDATAGLPSGDEMPFRTPLTMDPNDPNVLWTGGQKVYRTTNGASHWTPASYDFPGDEVNAIEVARGNGEIVYVGLSSGEVVKTTNGVSGAPPTWTELARAWPETKGVTSIDVDPADPNTVYVAIEGFDVPSVWKSTDGGASWQNVESNMPDVPVQSVAVNPQNSGMVYVGTDRGIFESLDGGGTWRVANENLASTEVSDLEFRGSTSELYAFTYGRGVYRVNVGSAAPPPNDDVASATAIADGTNGIDEVNVRFATSAPQDPSLSCGPGGGAQAKSVWYSFTPQTGGTFEISTEGSNYDTVAAAFSGGPGALTPVACDDNSGPEQSSKMTVNASAGVTYYFELTRSSTATGDGLGGHLVFRIRAG